MPEQYISSDGLRDRIRTEVERHVNWFNEPLHTQCLVSVREGGMFRLASGNEEGLACALSFLAFSYLLPYVAQNPPLPEHFECFVLPIPEPGQGYSIASVGLHNMVQAIFPASVARLRFQAPREVNGVSMGIRKLFLQPYSGLCGSRPALRGRPSRPVLSAVPDEDVLRISAKMVCLLHDQECTRAFRAVRWHNLALRQDDALDHGQRPVALSTAFEILFDLPDHAKAGELCRQVDQLLSSGAEARFKAKNKRGRLVCHVSRKSYVVYKLYMWRNKVVHGNEYGETDLTLRVKGWGRKNLVLIASRVFGECLKAKYAHLLL